MSLISDRDLLIIEPSLFIAGAAAGTALASVDDAEVSGTTLTSASADFEAAEIGPAHVAIVNGAPVEIVARTGPTELEVSLPRAGEGDAKIAPGDGADLDLKVISFTRLIERVQRDLLRQAGLDEEDGEQPLDESAVVNAQAVGDAIALRAIAEAFTLAAAGEPTSESLAERAATFTRLASHAAARLIVLVDLDGDGEADAARPLRRVTPTRG